MPIVKDANLLYVSLYLISLYITGILPRRRNISSSNEYYLVEGTSLHKLHWKSKWSSLNTIPNRIFICRKKFVFFFGGIFGVSHYIQNGSILRSDNGHTHFSKNKIQRNKCNTNDICSLLFKVELIDNHLEKVYPSKYLNEFCRNK